MSDNDERFSCYTYQEVRTGTGQLVMLTIPSDANREEIAKFFEANVRSVDMPVNDAVGVPHGGYGSYSRYDIKQHRYAGGGNPGSGGFIEVLEIRNPPEGRWGIIIHEYLSCSGSTFYEWSSIAEACQAFEKVWGTSRSMETMSGLPGFRRGVVCNMLTPWFYAIGGEDLVGDFALPRHLQDDPVFRLGRWFVVFDSDGIPSIKTCMGTRLIVENHSRYPYGEYQYRIVQWDDGSVWRENSSCTLPPRPAEEGELWIAEAIQQFRRLLAGKIVQFFIEFLDGSRFVGKLFLSEKKPSCPEGDYLLVVKIKGEDGVKEGFVHDFKPTPDSPDILSFVTANFAKQGKEVEYVKIKSHKSKGGNRRWSGAFFPRKRD